MKRISIKETVYEIITNQPDILEIMIELGFEDIAKPGMLKTAGRVMTIEKGASMKRIDIETIAKKFAEHGYELTKEA